MNKLKQFKQAIRNPPPERLAAIEYRSAFMQMLGVSIVSVVLIIKGLWYIIFAFIFSIGMSYAQGMTALQKYKMIVALKTPEKPEDFDKDVSPTRRRSKIINHIFGRKAHWVSVILAVGVPYFYIPNISWWLYSMAYLISILVWYTLVYFFVFYWIAYQFYKKRLGK